MSPTELPFHASSAERLFRPGEAWSRVERTPILAILVAALFYSLLFALLVYENGFGAAEAPGTREIPIEIVVEPPPPPPPTPTPTPSAPEPPKMAQPEDEKPAFDAPRAANNDKRDDENAADAAKPSAAPPPPSEAPPAPAPAPEPPAAPQAPDLRTAPDGDTPEVAKADPVTPPDKPTPTPEKPAPAPAKKFPTFASVPDIDFGGAAMSTPVAGGNAKATYLSILYGMITPRVHVPPIARTYGRRLKGSIVFTVDGRGRLTERWVAQPSGSSELDEAAMQAVGSASPFPAPPRGAPMGMRFNYGVN